MEAGWLALPLQTPEADKRATIQIVLCWCVGSVPQGLFVLGLESLAMRLAALIYLRTQCEQENSLDPSPHDSQFLDF